MGRAKRYRTYKEGTKGSRDDPVFVGRQTDARKFGVMVAARVRKFGEMYSQSMGTAAMYVAVAALFWAEKKMRRQLQPGGSYEGKRMVGLVQWQELSSSSIQPGAMPKDAGDCDPSEEQSEFRSEKALETCYRCVPVGPVPESYIEGNDVAMRVSAQTNPGKLAGSIASRIEADGEATVLAVGPRAVARVVRSVRMAEGFLQQCVDEGARIGLVAEQEGRDWLDNGQRRFLVEIRCVLLPAR